MVPTSSPRFSLDILLLIFAELNVRTLILLRQVCRQVHQGATLALSAKYNDRIRPFSSRPDEFRKTLDTTNTVISGSFVVEFLVNDPFPKINNLNLCTTEPNVEGLLSFLNGIGFEQDAGTDGSNEGGSPASSSAAVATSPGKGFEFYEDLEDDDGEYDVYGVRTEISAEQLSMDKPEDLGWLRSYKEDIHLIRDEVSIDINIASSLVNLLPIRMTWSTVLFNFMTGSGFCSAYPQSTFERRGIITRQGDLSNCAATLARMYRPTSAKFRFRLATYAAEAP